MEGSFERKALGPKYSKILPKLTIWSIWVALRLKWFKNWTKTGLAAIFQQLLPKVLGLPSLFKQPLPRVWGLVTEVARDGECVTWMDGTVHHPYLYRFDFPGIRKSTNVVSVRAQGTLVKGAGGRTLVLGGST